MAKFIINNLVYDTEKMEFITKVKKLYPLENVFEIMVYGKNMGRWYSCDLYRSEKGRYLLVHKDVYDCKAEDIDEEEAKQLLMQHDYDTYVQLFGELDEA